MTGQHELVTQRSARPTNKVLAAGLTGSALTLALGLLDVASQSTFGGAWWGALAATAAATVAGYLRKNRSV